MRAAQLAGPDEQATGGVAAMPMLQNDPPSHKYGWTVRVGMVKRRSPMSEPKPRARLIERHRKLVRVRLGIETGAATGGDGDR